MKKEYSLRKLLDKYKELNIYFNGDNWFKKISEFWDFEHRCKQAFSDFPSEGFVSETVSVGEIATIQGPVIIGKGVKILNGTVVEGPVFIGKNSVIGPNCYIRPKTVIGCNVRIGCGAEIKESLINSNVNIAHFSYVGHSVIGKGTMLGAGVIIATRRLDDKTIQIKIEKKIVDTRKKKIGAYIGSNVKIGVGVQLMPGTIISANRKIYPSKCAYID